MKPANHWADKTRRWGARFGRVAVLVGAGLVTAYAVRPGAVRALGPCGNTPSVPSTACFTRWVCDGDTWVPSGFKAAGTACSDGTACTVNDQCDGQGTCVGTPTCQAPSQCQVLSCNATTGACSYSPKANGVACNDGNACTQTDTCQGGTCVGSNPVMCTALDQCHNVGTCNPATGICSNPLKSSGAACDDGNKCTSNDSCDSAGNCVGTSVSVDDQKACTFDSCDPATGAITHTPAVSDAECSSGTYFCYDKYGNVTRKVVCVDGVPCDTSCP